MRHRARLRQARGLAWGSLAVALAAVGVALFVELPRAAPELPPATTQDVRLPTLPPKPPNVPDIPEPTEPAAPAVPDGLSDVQARAWAVLVAHGRTGEWDCMSEIFMAESSWRPDAIGDVDIGGSYGLPQRHAPAHGKPPWPWPVEEQVEWALAYADERYGGMCEAAETRREQGWW